MSSGEIAVNWNGNQKGAMTSEPLEILDVMFKDGHALKKRF
ncbi:MAG: hypothetical protein ACKVJU_10350 [Verrucomicrobiales bacterium]